VNKPNHTIPFSTPSLSGRAGVGIKTYQKTDYAQWNAFIGQAKNATFLFHRDFMEYHNDRFEDYSLIVLDGEKWVAVLPANREGNEVYSHQGLTYGGLVYKEQTKLAKVTEIFQAVLLFLKENKIEKLQIKTIPSIYHIKPAEELQYALFLADAKLIRRDTLSVIDLSQKSKIATGRLEGVQKGIKKELKIIEVTIFDDFWDKVLIPNLQDKYNAKPVHSLNEITSLKLLFPDNIRQFNVYDGDIIVAGTTIFESQNVAHAQYISGNESKSENGSLDFLYHHLITNIFKNKKFFDFGISNEAQGKILNNGLCFWKESFGASTVVHDFYEIIP
jgi:hypothetical protein